MYSKLNRTKEEDGIIWSTWRTHNCYDWANEFRNRMINIIDSDELIYDLSHIFDAESDIYMDDCHVYEKGNKIIADYIYEIIKKIAFRTIKFSRLVMKNGKRTFDISNYTKL